MTVQGDNLGTVLDNPYHFKIYDQAGLERMSIVSDQVALTINVAALQNGLYHAILLVEQEGETEPLRFQKHFQIAR